MKAGVVALMAAALLGCSDSKEINAAFSRNQISWMVFDPSAANGLRALSGFGQGMKVSWAPRDRAAVTSDVLPLSDRRGAMAVSHLGLLIFDDSTGALTAQRPGAQFSMQEYETDRLFEWNARVFVGLRQEAPLEAPPEHPPASLAWWSTGQARLAFYPIPSQVRDPSRQVVAFDMPRPGSLQLTWKIRQNEGWVFEKTSLSLADGSEGAAGDIPSTQGSPDPRYAALRLRLSQRLGTSVASTAGKGSGPHILFTASGWVASDAPEGARLYRLPDLGGAGRYTAALALDKGYVFAWETAYRGYVGAAGVVHVPFSVLAP